MLYTKIVRENGNYLYKCVDSSRKMFYYLERDEIKTKDSRCFKLIGITKQIIKIYFRSSQKKDKHLKDTNNRSYSESSNNDCVNNHDFYETNKNNSNDVYIWTYLSTPEFINHMVQLSYLNINKLFILRLKHE